MKIYNTLAREKVELKEKKLGIYVCGPTVYDEPHIGHARSAYVFDVIIKFLRWKGIKVKFVRNVTDIDDKIIEKARREPGSDDLKAKVKKISAKYLKSYHEDMNSLGLVNPDKEPKATETIGEMIKFITTLIKKGYAYESNGNVYFDIKKFKGYGKLSGQSLEEMEEGARIALDKNKKDPLDFALWKASKEDEPSWPSPWGNGRPGWHIECSVMSTKFLGKDFLIHGGGLDLVFPHHENEIAQTVCAGKQSAKYWIHNGLLTINGQKMSKSLGNFITIKNFQKDTDLLKLLFLSSHYKHPVDYTESKIKEMEEKKDRILAFLQKVDAKIKGSKKISKKNPYAKEFTEAMEDDFNTPLAFGVIFKCIGEANKLLDKDKITADDKKNLEETSSFVRNVLENIFGLSLEYKEKDKTIEKLIEERQKARSNKNYKKADEIREKLLEQGVVLEDTKEGPVWRKKG